MASKKNERRQFRELLRVKPGSKVDVARFDCGAMFGREKDAAADELAGVLRSAGRDVETEVYKWTPFGKRYIDIEVSSGGKVLGGIETKVGNSVYTAAQRAKDAYLRVVKGYQVNLVRQP